MEIIARTSSIELVLGYSLEHFNECVFDYYSKSSKNYDPQCTWYNSNCLIQTYLKMLSYAKVQNSDKHTVQFFCLCPQWTSLTNLLFSHSNKFEEIVND